MSLGAGNLLLASAGDEGYNLTRSLRTRASASASLTRTPATAGNKQKMTWSFWVKPSLSSMKTLFACATSGSSIDAIGFDNGFGYGTERFHVFSSGNINLLTARRFRDPSAWYYFTVAIDTTQATSTDRVKIYVNGTQETTFDIATYPALNANISLWNSTNQNWIGNLGPFYSIYYFDGYLAEVNFIDGQALTPSSFGSTNATTGVWQPARYTGTYGTNGFYLPFTDNSALTTSSNVGLGKDFSGNGNYWTTNNISITAGVTYDSMTDVPTLTNATASNFAVANPVDQYLCSITQGNLSVATNNGGYGGGVRSTIAVSSGKWYWESVITVLGGTAGQAPVSGILPSTTPLNAIGSNTRYAYYGGNGNKLSSAGSVAYGATFSTGDVIGYALDLDAGTLTFYKNNTSQGTAFTGLSGSFCAAVYDPSTGGTTAINFGQRPFTYTPPTGFVALNTFNLPTSTILQGNKVMDATLYTGTGANQNIVNAGGFKPDFVWGKIRNSADQNFLLDSVRGSNNWLVSNSTNAENTDTTTLVSFNSNGFTVGTNTNLNRSGGYNFVGWQWQAGQGSTSSNTNGSITSTVSVNASAGFSVVTYTGNATNPSTVGHGLGVAPALIIVKNRSVVSSWLTYHQSIGNTNYLLLNTTGASAASSSAWNNTSPTSSVFTIGSFGNGNGNSLVAYCWTPIAGYSAMGSYSGNGSTDGPFVYTGFRPKFVMIKRYDVGAPWLILDSSRNTYNVVNNYLLANASDAEGSGSSPNDVDDFLSNGFKIRCSNAGQNASGGGYIYMAFAESPFRNSLAR